MFFSSDDEILDDVYKRLDGRFTKEQIHDVFVCSISYINYTMRYTEATEVKIPYLGKMYCNVEECKLALKRLKYKAKWKYISKADRREMEMLEKKIPGMDSLDRRKNPYFRNIIEFYYKLRYGMSWEELEKFQNSKRL